MEPGGPTCAAAPIMPAREVFRIIPRTCSLQDGRPPDQRRVSGAWRRLRLDFWAETFRLCERPAVFRVRVTACESIRTSAELQEALRRLTHSSSCDPWRFLPSEPVPAISPASDSICRLSRAGFGRGPWIGRSPGISASRARCSFQKGAGQEQQQNTAFLGRFSELQFICVGHFAPKRRSRSNDASVRRRRKRVSGTSRGCQADAVRLSAVLPERWFRLRATAI